MPTPCLDYDLEINSLIEKYRDPALLKSSSIGHTQLILIYILIRILAQQKAGNSAIICGNDTETSRGMMRRLHAFLVKNSIYSYDRETVFPWLPYPML